MIPARKNLIPAKSILPAVSSFDMAYSFIPSLINGNAHPQENIAIIANNITVFLFVKRLFFIVLSVSFLSVNIISLLISAHIFYA